MLNSGSKGLLNVSHGQTVRSLLLCALFHWILTKRGCEMQQRHNTVLLRAELSWEKCVGNLTWSVKVAEEGRKMCVKRQAGRPVRQRK